VATIDGPAGPIEVLATGSGDPVTVFAHGLAGSIPETRPFGSGVPGTRWFFHFRGHGRSAAPEVPVTYHGLAGELREVLDHARARRVLGVSLGAGALLRVAAEEPDRLDRLVLVLPAAISEGDDEVVRRMRHRAALAEAGDAEGLAQSLLAEQPPEVRARPAVRLWAQRQAERLTTPALVRMLHDLPGSRPVEDPAALPAITCPALVVGQQDDPAHPVAVAERLGHALPSARVEVLPPGGLLWTHRARVRALVSEFLAAT